MSCDILIITNLFCPFYRFLEFVSSWGKKKRWWYITRHVWIREMCLKIRCFPRLHWKVGVTKSDGSRNDGKQNVPLFIQNCAFSVVLICNNMQMLIIILWLWTRFGLLGFEISKTGVEFWWKFPFFGTKMSVVDRVNTHIHYFIPADTRS